MESVGRFLPAIVESSFVFGPRGTGKTTWLRALFPDALYVDLLAPDQLRHYLAKPERLREVVSGNPERATVIIDEVQRAPEILSVVHALIEEDKRRRFILTGSSARKVRRSGVDLLAGRAVVRTCHPFMAAELGATFDLGRALTHGLVPLVTAARSPEEALRAYVTLYLREEVQAEGLVRNIGDFSRFLEIMSFSHAGVLNLAEVARECEIGRKTVEGYVAILNDLLIAFSLPVFAKRAKRRLVAHRKFYYFDAGVFNSLRPAGALDRPEEIGGAALEGLVAQHLRAWNDYRGGRNDLFFWRTKAGNEVDFVVYGPQQFTAIEVKNADKVFAKDLRGLRSFHEDYPEADRLLLYRGKERLRIDEVACVPCEEFLRGLRPEKPLA
jgi:predicted AAA+ superfamily ATPase